MSVVSNFGAKPCFLTNLRISRSAERLSASARNPHIEDLSLMIDGAPQVHPLAGDADHHLVEVPSIAAAVVHRGPELQNASAHRLIGNIEPALGEQILHVATAQGEPEI